MTITQIVSTFWPWIYMAFLLALGGGIVTGLMLLIRWLIKRNK